MRPASQDPDCASLRLAHRLDVTQREEADQARLARATPPRLGEHRGWDDRRDLFGEEPGMQDPGPPVVALRGIKAPVSYVTPATQADRAVRLRSEAPASSARARAKPSASSSALS